MSKRDAWQSDAAWMGTDGPPLPSGQRKRPLSGAPALQRGRYLFRLEFIQRWMGYRTRQWMARHLGMSMKALDSFMDRNELAPTLRDGLLRTGEAADILGVSPQSVIALIKRGDLRGWRNPGGVWWVVPRDEVTRFIARHGQVSDDMRLRGDISGPRVIRAWHGARRRPKRRRADDDD